MKDKMARCSVELGEGGRVDQSGSRARLVSWSMKPVLHRLKPPNSLVYSHLARVAELADALA